MARAVSVSGCSGPRTRSSDRAAARRTGRGPRPHPPPARSSRRGWRGRPACTGCSGRGPARRTGSSAAYWSRAPAGSPASPVKPARLARMLSVSGCSGPETRSSDRAPARRTGHGPRPHPPPARSSGQGWRGRSACPGARGRRPARPPAAAPRTGRGPRPHPPPARSRGRGRRGRPGCPGARRRGTLSRAREHLRLNRSRAAGVAAAMRRGSARSAHMPSLVRSRTAWACGSSAAHTGQVSGSCGVDRGSRPRSGRRRPAAMRRPARRASDRR